LLHAPSTTFTVDVPEAVVHGAVLQVLLAFIVILEVEVSVEVFVDLSCIVGPLDSIILTLIDLPLGIIEGLGLFGEIWLEGLPLVIVFPVVIHELY